MSYNSSAEMKLRDRIRVLRQQKRFWIRVAALLGTLLLACAIALVLQWLKLPQ